MDSFLRLLEQASTLPAKVDPNNKAASYSHKTIGSSQHWDLLKYVADICHLLSFIILIYNMLNKKNCLGVSYRTQEIYLVIFVLRYSDLLFLPQPSLWNLVFKILFISLTVYAIYLIRFKRPVCVSYEALMDKFPHRITIYPIAVIVGLILKDYSGWSYFHPIFHKVYNITVVMEAMAIIPQLSLLRKIREIEIVTGGYIFCLGIYRGIYLLSWIWRIFEQEEYFSHIYIKFIFGAIQFLLYGDFILNYIKCVREKKPYVDLPM